MKIRGYIGVFAFILLVYGSTCFYVGKRLFQGLAHFFPNISGRVYIAVYILLTLSLILGFLPLPAVFRNILRWAGACWMGIFIQLLLFLAAAELVLFAGGLVRLIPSPLPQHIRAVLVAAAAVLTVGTLCYGVFNATRVKTVSYEVRLDKTALSGEMNVVLISDLHLGDAFSERRLERIARDVNRLKPDLVCIAGDIFSNDFNAIRDPGKAIAAFKSIETAYGVYACLGNHDAGSMLDGMLEFLEEGNVKVLKDEYAVIDGRLILLGRLDRSPIGRTEGMLRMEPAEMAGVISSMGQNLPIVVMDHNPARIDQYGEETDLILAGHTHRGQIFPGSLITNAMYTVHYGYYRENENSPQVIVTQGAGTWMLPVRIGTSNEIVRITLR